MAVNENDQPSVAPGSVDMGQPAQAPQRPAQAQPTQQQQLRVGARNLNSVMSRPFSKSAVNETVQTITKTFNEFIKSEVEAQEPGFRVLVIDSKHSLTALSAIAVCLAKSRGGQEYVSVHTMLVSGGTKLNNRSFQNSGQTFEIITVPGDVADAEMRKRVLMAVQEAYGSRTRILESAANIIHDELDVNDKHKLRSVFGNAIQACWQTMVIEKVIDEAPFNASVIGSGDTLTAYVDMHPRAIVNTSDLPVRNDISIQLQAVVQQASNSQPEQVIGLTQVDGFIDLVYQPPGPPQQTQWGQMPMANTQRYTPRFVLTQFQSIIDAATMELQLLALASSAILIENIGGAPQWMNAFKPRSTDKGDVDMRDIGAVGLEVNFTNAQDAKPVVIDTKTNNFGTQDLYKLINVAMYPNLIYSLDVDEAGDLSYLNLPFIIAAGAINESYTRAYDLITNAANALTNNNFSRCWNGITGNASTERYFLNDENRIFTGYYFGKDGTRKDIRDIDYLAIMNMVGRKNQSFIKEWSDTFDRRDIPMEVRLDRRRRIYESILPGNVNIKGYARRITMNPKFMVALVQACKDSGLSFRPSNLNTEYNVGTEHGVANANTLYGVAPNASGLFSYGNANAGAQPGMGFNLGFTGMGRNF